MKFKVTLKQRVTATVELEAADSDGGFDQALEKLIAVGPVWYPDSAVELSKVEEV